MSKAKEYIGAVTVMLCKVAVEFGEMNEENARLKAQRDALAALLKRYRNETPLGHQPHMIAREVDAVLATLEDDK